MGRITYETFQAQLRQIGVWDELSASAMKTGTTLRAVHGRSRDNLVKLARHAAVRFVKRRFPSMSSTELGELFGLHHTSVLEILHAPGKYRRRELGQGTCAQLRARVAALESALRFVEWRGWADHVGDGGYECCPACEGRSPNDDSADGRRWGGERGAHKPGCALAEALKPA